MKFRCEKFQRLRVHGVGQFVNGVLETDDEDAIARIKRVADRYRISAVADRTDPFNPTEHTVDVVNAYLATADEAERARVLEAEAAGKKRSGILNPDRWLLPEERAAKTAAGDAPPVPEA